MEDQQRIKDWESRNYPWMLIDKRFYYFRVIAEIIILIAFIGVFIYLAETEKFKDEIDCGDTNLTVEGDTVLIPGCPEIPGCPINVCEVDCDCPNFPENLKINLNNSTT